MRQAAVRPAVGDALIAGDRSRCYQRCPSRLQRVDGVAVAIRGHRQQNTEVTFGSVRGRHSYA